jgi:phosphatidylserine decarboxylase
MVLSIDAGILALGVIFLTALSRKWTLPRGKSAALIAIGTATGGIALGLCLRSSPPLVLLVPAVWLCQLVGYVAVLAWLFYRDPDRAMPADSGGIVSPADGKVIYIRKLTAGTIPVAEKKGRSLMLADLAQSKLSDHELWQIGISMVFTDVHVNRAPIAGKVTLVQRRPGRFLSLRDDDAVGVNERQTLVIENQDVQIGLVQIASRLVRRIVAYVVPGESVAAGQRIGMIKFGSQVDLFIPVKQCPSLRVDVSDLLVAGVTPIGVIAR